MSDKLKEKLGPIADKIGAFFKNLSVRNFSIIFGVLLLLFVIFDLAVLLTVFQIRPMEKVVKDINDYKEKIKNTEINLTRKDQFANDRKNLKLNLKDIQTKIKLRQEVSVILEQLSRMADDNMVNIDHIMPNFEYQETLIENDQRRYLKLPIEIAARSGYHAFGRFLNEIEKNDIAFSIDSFSISSAQESQLNEIGLTLSAIIFEVVEAEENE